MNHLVWISHKESISEIIVSEITIKKLRQLVEVEVIESSSEKPISFRVACDKYLCTWLNLPYKELIKGIILE
jgi:hypothetical protein